MDIFFLIFLLVIIVVLLITGFLKRDNVRSNVLVMFGGIGLMLLGVFSLMGVTYISGVEINVTSNSSLNSSTNVTTVNSFEVRDDVTSTWVSDFNPEFFLFCELLGLALLLISIINLSFGRFKGGSKVKGVLDYAEEEE